MEQHRGCNESSSSNPQVSLKTIGDLALAMMSKQPTYQTEMFTSDRTLYIRMLKSNSTTLTEADITKPRLKSTDAVNILLCHCTPVISYLHAVNSSAFHTSRAKILQVFQHIRDKVTTRNKSITSKAMQSRQDVRQSAVHREWS